MSLRIFRPAGFAIPQLQVSGFVIRLLFHRPAGFAIPQLQVSGFVIRLSFIINLHSTCTTFMKA
jgi:hypothetical protein